MRKMAFFRLFLRDVPQKVWENSVFSRLLGHFVKVRKKSVFFFLRDVMQKVWVFFHVFQDTLYKVRRKGEKSAFFELFLQLLRKQCSFTFFKTLCTNFAENKQNQRFLSFFCDVPEKVWGNSVFLRFLRHFKIKFEKMRKTSFFELFARCSAKSVRKQCFFHVFRNTLYKVRKKCWKTAFFELFLRRSAKSVRKQCFIHFFSATFRKKCEKTVFFHVFRDNLCKFRKKNVKRTLFARRSAKSVRKQCFFSRFLRHFVQSLQKKTFFFARRFAKSVSDLSRFSRQFVQRSQKIRKMSVFWVFF